MSIAVGLHALGLEPLAGSILHDPPVINLTSPTGTLSTGGPTVNVAWDYSQAQGDPQEKYRIRVTNDADTVTHYDTGWILSTDQSVDLDWDALELPSDSTDVTIQLAVVGATIWTVTDSEAIEMQWGVPHCTIDTPTDSSIWTDPTGIDMTWTFTDDRAGKTQGWYRARVLDRDTGLSLYDTSWVASAAALATLEYLPSDGQQLTLELQLKNNHGIRSD